MGDATTRMKKRGHSRLVVFGRRAVQEALEQDAATLQVEEIFAAAGLPGALRKELSARARVQGATYQAVPADQVHAISEAPRHDQGVVLRDPCTGAQAENDLPVEAPRRLEVDVLEAGGVAQLGRS